MTRRLDTSILADAGSSSVVRYKADGASNDVTTVLLFQLHLQDNAGDDDDDGDTDVRASGEDGAGRAKPTSTVSSSRFSSVLVSVGVKTESMDEHSECSAYYH